jgi:hypothetical protein
LAGTCGTHNAPDYCFRIGGARKFFLEAKKPSVSIKDEPTPAYQLRRYAWSAKLPLSLLTDFEELAIYDCRVKPEKTDKPTIARINHFTFEQYPERWDEIAGVFSKDAVLRGSFDRFAEETKGKKGTAAVDAEFLKEIERWRELLARNIALRNPQLFQPQLNEAVQRTIDRIVFLRIWEDRGIETQYPLQGLQNGTNVYRRLFELFQRADERYNSGLFHFQREEGFVESPDTLTPGLKIDDKVLKDIVTNLYYPDSPYEFSVLPADILGQVYEQFLGKVIRLTEGHRAKVEDKPEVKKAGGVYYTPTYIVDYIVEHTVGELLKGKTPYDVGAGLAPARGRPQGPPLRVLDPACGSGSFLLGAYQRLLDWHRDWYVNDGPEKHTKPRKGGQPALFQAGHGEWRLTTAERKRILLNSIFGVDIDPQAVEVTKLSLLLKVLEGESEESINAQLKLFHQRALPDLASNIKCGNSLIGSDFFQGRQGELFDDEEALRVNPFDWDKGFPEIFGRDNPGFDAVIGNPPYLNVDDVWGRDDQRLTALRRAYGEIYNDKTDILFYFLARATTLSRGVVALIVSRAFLEAFKADKLRAFLVRNAAIDQIVDFQNFPVFPGVGISTCVIVFRPRGAVGGVKASRLQSDLPRPYDLLAAVGNPLLFERVTLPQSHLGAEPWIFLTQKDRTAVASIDAVGVPLDEVLRLGQGMQTGRNDVFAGLSAGQLRSWHVPRKLRFKRASNSDIQRYAVRDRGEYVLFLEDVRSFSELPAGLQNYLKVNSAKLKERAAFRRGNCEWWKFTWPLHKDWYGGRKILCPYLATTNRFAPDLSGEFLSLTDTTVLFDAGQPEDLLYFVGLLNSRLLTFRFKRIAKLKSAGIYEYFWNSVSKLRVRRIDFSSAHDRARHDRLVTLVRRMLALHAKLAAARTDHEKIVLQRQINATDREIDALVYELYGLTDDEIKIVEEAHDPSG